VGVVLFIVMMATAFIGSFKKSSFIKNS